MTYEIEEYIDDYFPWLDDYMPKTYDIRHTQYFPQAPPDRPYDLPETVTLTTLIPEGAWIGVCHTPDCSNGNEQPAGVCHIFNCNHANEQPAGTFENIVYNAREVYFVFYATDQSYVGDAY